MTTAEQYNEAVRDLAAVQKRNQELETRHTGQMMRIEELMDAVETVNRAGVLKARALEARIIVLEAVREAIIEVRKEPYMPSGLPGGPVGKLDAALAAAEKPDDPTDAHGS